MSKMHELELRLRHVEQAACLFGLVAVVALLLAVVL